MNAMSGSFHLRCSECGSEHQEDPALLVCPKCAIKQQAGGETRGVLEVEMHHMPSTWPDHEPGSAAFLRAFLPISHGAPFPALAVGATPLLSATRLAETLGIESLYLKDDTRNPSGSTKDRASQLVAMKAIEYGYSTVATASTGNAATALAAIAAATGLEAIVFVPRSAPRAKLIQIASYGARLMPVNGSYDDAFELCLACCERFDWYNRNTALNPFTIEGKKTAALEIAAQLAPHEADVVVVPTGDGVILSGIAKGFSDAQSAGLISKIPRLVAVQPEGSSVIARAIAEGGGTAPAMAGAHSVADSLTVDMPRNLRLCVRRIRESGGGAITVPDSAIVEAIGKLARSTGIFAEPAAACALAGLEKALEQGIIASNERCVLMITGTGLKDIDAAGKAIEFPSPIEPSVDAIERLLG